LRVTFADECEAGVPLVTEIARVLFPTRDSRPRVPEEDELAQSTGTSRSACRTEARIGDSPANTLDLIRWSASVSIHAWVCDLAICLSVDRRDHGTHLMTLVENLLSSSLFPPHRVTLISSCMHFHYTRVHVVSMAPDFTSRLMRTPSNLHLTSSTHHRHSGASHVLLANNSPKYSKGNP